MNSNPNLELLSTSQRAQLTPRESEVAYWNAQGFTNKEIAKELHISPETVKVHIQHACEKLGASNRTALVMESFRHGLLRIACIVLSFLAQLIIETSHDNSDARVQRAKTPKVTRIIRIRNTRTRRREGNLLFIVKEDLVA